MGCEITPSGSPSVKATAFGRSGATLALLLLAGCGTPAPHGSTPLPSAVSGPRFVEVARESGIDFVHKWGDAAGPIDTLETTGAGCCFLDYDRDGWLDLYLVNSGRTDGRRPIEAGRAPNRLYRNLGNGRFQDVTDRAGAPGGGFGMGCAAGDYDGDGWVDLFVAGYGGSRLYRNRGDGTFADVTARTGVGGRPHELSTAAAWADVTGDGRLDLYVTNYLKWNPALRYCHSREKRTACSPSVYAPQPNHLWRANPGGTFSDITAAAGVANPEGKGLAALFSDVDDDGRLDLFVANDGTGNRLFRQIGSGEFRDVTLEAGVGHDADGKAQAGMGCDFADADGSGRFSLAVATFQNEVKTLYLNAGGGLFRNETDRRGLGAPTLAMLAFGALFLDYDNDGDRDLLFTNGHVQNNIAEVEPSVTYAQVPRLFRNDGRGNFTDVSRTAGPVFSTPAVARGVCAGDWDNDGDPDVLINNSGGPASLWKNEGGSRKAWITLELVGRPPNTQAVGSRVTVHAGNLRQTAEVRTSGGYLSTPDLRVHFGLGECDRIDRIQVRWPDGTLQELGAQPTRQFLKVRQPHPGNKPGQ